MDHGRTLLTLLVFRNEEEGDQFFSQDNVRPASAREDREHVGGFQRHTL
jgi:hypothetical protein